MAKVAETETDRAEIERAKHKYERLWDKIDNVLVNLEIKNEDMLNLSSPLKSSISINYDMKSLVKSEFVHDIEPELVDLSLTDEEYLTIARRRAESKLIKMRIIYKMNHDNQSLTENEKKYLQAWLTDM